MIKRDHYDYATRMYKRGTGAGKAERGGGACVTPQGAFAGRRIWYPKNPRIKI
ncbi:hypothetical protein [Paenibacillus tundrae]|uniref:hypothetical protein n=1 Tax=Paenibacillus tundrae TaxID=528187 RepID=UPI0027D81CF0|nr:hypothetical protein [Paenibacillus tundrae]